MNQRIGAWIKNETVREFVRFVLVGVLATGIHYGLYLLLIHLFHLEGTLMTNIAYSVGYLISWFCNLWLTAHFTFRKSVTLGRGAGFALSHLINYGLHILLLNLFLHLRVPKDWAPIPVYCIAVPVNFILVRTVFKKLR